MHASENKIKQMVTYQIRWSIYLFKNALFIQNIIINFETQLALFIQIRGVIQEKETKMCTFWHIASLVVTSVIFAICDLIFSFQNNTCVTVKPQGFDINLSIWLKVDAFSRIFAILAFICIFYGSERFRRKFRLDEEYQTNIIIIFTTLFGLFIFAWLIVGSVLFLSKLLPAGMCEGAVRVFMTAKLVISYLHILVFIGCCIKQVKQVESERHRTLFLK